MTWRWSRDWRRGVDVEKVLWYAETGDDVQAKVVVVRYADWKRGDDVEATRRWLSSWCDAQRLNFPMKSVLFYSAIIAVNHTTSAFVTYRLLIGGLAIFLVKQQTIMLQFWEPQTTGHHLLWQKNLKRYGHCILAVKVANHRAWLTLAEYF